MLHRLFNHLRRKRGCICWYAQHGTDDLRWHCPRHGRVRRA
jgi:hypothetical protein